jgi:hypothetical protein
MWVGGWVGGGGWGWGGGGGARFVSCINRRASKLGLQGVRTEARGLTRSTAASTAEGSLGGRRGHRAERPRQRWRHCPAPGRGVPLPREALAAHAAAHVALPAGLKQEKSALPLLAGKLSPGPALLSPLHLWPRCCPACCARRGARHQPSRPSIWRTAPRPSPPQLGWRPATPVAARWWPSCEDAPWRAPEDCRVLLCVGGMQV